MKSLSDFHEKFNKKIGSAQGFFALRQGHRRFSTFAGPGLKNSVLQSKHIVLKSASGTLDVQSLVSSGKFEREFGKLES